MKTLDLLRLERRLALHLLAAACLLGRADAATVFPIATNNADTCANMASDGTNYLVGIQGDYANPHYYITAQMFGPTGGLVGSRINPVPGHTGGNPYLACSGTNYLMIWPDDYLGGSYSSISGQLISRSGGLVGGMIAITANSQQKTLSVHPVAYGGGGYLVVWDDHRDGVNWAVYGQLVSSAGALVGGNFVISAPVNGQDEKGASVAFDGANFLVVWQLNSTSGGNHAVTYGVFISPLGAMGAPFAIGQTVSLDRNPLTLVFNGANYLVVWNYDSQLDGGGNAIWNLYGRFVTPSGTFLGNEFAIVTNGNPTFPGLAFDGANYLLCWNQGGVFATNASVQFQFLNSSGQPTGPQFAPFTAQGNKVPLLAPLLYDGKRFVSVATLSANGWSATNNADIYGTFILASTAPPMLTPNNRIGTQFSLQLTGTPGINYAVQVSTNLALSNWTAVVTNSPTNGTFGFTDTSAANKSRFYRAAKAP